MAQNDKERVTVKFLGFAGSKIGMAVADDCGRLCYGYVVEYDRMMGLVSDHN